MKNCLTHSRGRALVLAFGALTLVACGPSDRQLELEEEVKTLTAAKSEVDSSLAEVRSALQSAEQNATDLGAELEGAKASLAEATASVERGEQALAASEAQVAELEGRVESASARALNLSRLVDTTRSEMQARIDAAEQEVDAQSQRAASLGASLSAARTAADENDREVGELEMALATAQADAEAAAADAAGELATTRSLADNASRALDNLREESSATITALESDLAAARGRASQLGARLAEVQSALGVSESEMGNMAARIEAAVADAARLGEERDAVASQLTAVTMERDQALASVGEVEGRLEEAEGTLNAVPEGGSAALAEEYAALRAARENLDNLARVEHERIVERQRELASAWERLRERFDEERRSLGEMQAAFEAERQFLKSRTGELADERTRLQADLRASYEQMSAMRAALDAARARVKALEGN